MNTTPKPEVLELGCETAYNNIISCISKHDLKPGKKLNAECEAKVFELGQCIEAARKLKYTGGNQ